MKYPAMSDDVLLPGIYFCAELGARFIISGKLLAGAYSFQPVTGGKPEKTLI